MWIQIFIKAANTLSLVDQMNEKWPNDRAYLHLHIDWLIQERRNSSALAMELRISGINLSIYPYTDQLSA